MPSESNSSVRNDQNGIEQFLQTFGIGIIYIGIIVLLIFNLGPWYDVEVSWRTIALITLLLVTPFVSNLKSIWVSNVGGLELQTEISEARVSLEDVLPELKQKPDVDDQSKIATDEKSDNASSSEMESGDSELNSESNGSEIKTASETDLNSNQINNLGGDPSEIATDLYRLLENDPRLALAKLRMEMEEAVDDLIVAMGYERPQVSQTRYDILNNHERIGNNILDTYSQIKDLSNKAIHGDKVQMQDAIEIVDIGTDFISGIRSRELYERFKRGEELNKDELDILDEHPVTDQQS